MASIQQIYNPKKELPAGGTTGQILTKASNTSGDVHWQSSTGGQQYTAGAGIAISAENVISATGNSSYDLPVASRDTLGGIIVGDGLAIYNRVLRATAQDIIVDVTLNVNSNNPVRNSVVTAALNNKANSTHEHVPSDITGLITDGLLTIDLIPTGTTANTVSLGNHTHTYSSLTDKPTNVSFFTNNVGYITSSALTDYVTTTALTTGLSGKADTGHSHSYADLTDKPVIPTVPTNVSAFTNDSGYLTTHQDISGKANKATTLAGYDITNAYTKTEVDAKVASVYRFKGNAANYAALPSTGQVVGDVYNLSDTGANYAWTGSAWDKLSETVDLSGYATTVALNNGLSTKANVTHKHSANDIDSGTVAIARIPTGTTSTTVALGNHTHSYTSITGTPTLSTVATSGSYSDLTNKPTIPSAYTLPAATASIRGGIRVGSGLTISGDVLNATGTDVTIDSALDASSVNPVQNGVITTALNNKAAATHTHSTATASAAGFLSATDKAKLDGISAGANNYTYTLPAATGSTLGGIKVGNNLAIDSDNILSATDTTYTAGTGLERTGTQFNVKLGTDHTTAAYGDHTHTYDTITDTPTFAAVATSGSYSDLINKPNAYTLPPATGSVLGGVKIGSGISITADGAISAESAGTKVVTADNKTSLQAVTNLSADYPGDTRGNGAVDLQMYRDDNSTIASGSYSVAMGYGNTASCYVSVAMGYYNTASGDYSVAMGLYNTASGYYSVAMGGYNTASGVASVAMGGNNAASGESSVTMGGYNTASGNYSVAMGYGNTASVAKKTVFGKYNKDNTDTVFDIGWGTDDTTRSNIFEITNTGIVYTNNRAKTLATTDLVEISDLLSTGTQIGTITVNDVAYPLKAPTAGESVTYTAGTGLELADGVFSVPANTYADYGHSHTTSDISDLISTLSDYATVSHTHDYSTITGTPALAPVATSGDYSDLSNTPDFTVTYSPDVASGVTLGTLYQGGTPITLYAPTAGESVTYTAGTGLSLSNNEFSVADNTYASYSHTHAYSTITGTPTEATTSTAGLLSAVDKTKLNGIATGANNYTLPTATTSVLGGVKVDGSSITITNGVISASGSGGGSGTGNTTIVFKTWEASDTGAA